MLVLTRNLDERITVETPSGPLEIVLLRAQNDKARIGIIAPRDWRIMRNELLSQGGGGAGGQGQG